MIDVFKIGVHIGMTTNAGGVLSVLMRELVGVNTEAGHLNHRLGQISTIALGAGAVFAGWGVVKGLLSATKHAENLNHELTKLQTGARLSDDQTAAASRLAFKVSRAVPGTDVAGNVKTLRELYGVFGDMATAQKILPTVALGSKVTSNYVDKDTDLAQVAIRALELRGHITKDGKVDAADFQKEFNAMVRSIVASEGLIDPKKLYLFIRQAGPAARNMSADQMWGMGPAIINALGAGPAGTAMMSFFQQMVGHVIAGKRIAIAMENAGWLKHGSWKVERGGHVVMDQNAVPDQAGFMDHPFTWLHDHLDAMRNQKDAHGKPIDVVGIVQKIFQLSSRQTSARLINDVDQNWPVLQNEERRWDNMPNPDAINKKQNDKDLSVNIKNLAEAWKNFTAAVGQNGIPLAISVLHGLTDDLNTLQAAVLAHPTIAKDVFELVGGLAGLTVLGGSLTILNACWAPFGGGLLLLVRAAGGGQAVAAAGGMQTLAIGMEGLAGALAPFAAGAAAFVGIDMLMNKLHELGQFGNKAGFAPMTGGPAQGVPDPPPGVHPGYWKRPPGVAPMPGDDDFRVAPASPYVAPASTKQSVQLRGDVNLDGKKVGTIIAGGMASSLGQPPTGPNNPDLRVSPWMPGLLGAQ